VIIGAGIVGLTAALTLAERGVKVVVLEKGRIAGEQSSRNLGWIRKTNRAAFDVPMAVAADQLWKAIARRVGADVGYRQTGIMFLAKTDSEIANYESWLQNVKGLDLDSTLLSPHHIEEYAPGGQARWAGAIFTPSDGRAEPTLASSAIANAALQRGVTIVEGCAVRRISKSAGRVSGVETERGEIHCEHVLLAGGFWSRRFLGNHSVFLPTLPLVASVIQTGPMEGPTEIAVGGPDFSFRKRLDGGFTVTQRGALGAPLTLDHLIIGSRYLKDLRAQRDLLHISLGRHFLTDLRLPRRWKEGEKSPFESIRTMDPRPDENINEDAMQNLSKAWPIFETARVKQTWAGMMDITPDSLPVISPVEAVPGLTVATGFSGHGFGTAPAAGQLAADIISGAPPLIDPSPYRLDRF